MAKAKSTNATSATKTPTPIIAPPSPPPPLLRLAGEVIGKATSPHLDQPVIVTITVPDLRANLSIQFINTEQAKMFGETVRSVQKEDGTWGREYPPRQQLYVAFFDKAQMDEYDAQVAAALSSLAALAKTAEEKENDNGAQTEGEG